MLLVVDVGNTNTNFGARQSKLSVLRLNLSVHDSDIYRLFGFYYIVRCMNDIGIAIIALNGSINHYFLKRRIDFYYRNGHRDIIIMNASLLPIVWCEDIGVVV